MQVASHSQLISQREYQILLLVAGLEVNHEAYGQERFQHAWN